MKKPKHRHPPTPPAEEIRPSFFSNTVLLAMTGILGALLGYAGWQYYQDKPATPPAVANNTPPASTPATPAAQKTTPPTAAEAQLLRGKWVRTDSDGNYVLDIKNVTEDGKLDAAYLNPRPIHIAKAEASNVDGRMRVFVQFQDVNYPGSTYDLRYDAASDHLVGEYFQATQQQLFQVGFERVK